MIRYWPIPAYLPTHHPHSSMKRFLQFVVRHHQPVSFAKQAQMVQFVCSMFVFSQVCDVPTSDKSVEGKKKEKKKSQN